MREQVCTTVLIVVLLGALFLFDSFHSFSEKTAAITGAAIKQQDVFANMLVLQKGWNMISGPAFSSYQRGASNCKFDHIAAFSSDNGWSIQSKDVTISPEKGVFVEVVSDGTCRLKAEYGKEELQSLSTGSDLKQGWNLLSVTPQMAGKIPKDFAGTCSFDHDGGWVYRERDYKWVKAVPFSKNDVGQGLWLYAYKDCSISFSSDSNQKGNQKTGFGQSTNSCGDKCEEEPPLPTGTETIAYCSKPLIVPDKELQNDYKNYPNVKNHKEGKDNRYFVSVSKSTSNPSVVAIRNLKDVTVEPLLEGVSSDGEKATIAGNTAFIIHGNPQKKNPILDLCGWWCDEKQLELKANTKARLYPVEDCAALTSSMILGISQSPQSEGKLANLQATLFEAADDISRLSVVAIANALSELPTLETPIKGGDAIKVQVKVDMGGEPIPLLEGYSYAVSGEGGEIGVIYTTSGEVQTALEYARTLKNLKTPEEKVQAIDKWVADNGVYPTGAVIQQLGDSHTRTGEVNKFYDPNLAHFAYEVFRTSESPTKETLSNLMGNKLADGRFLCVCRDIALLTTAMAREAGANAWMITGRRVVGNLYGGHAWVGFKDSQGRIVGWDPTASLAEDLFEEIKPQFRNSISNLELFNGEYKLFLPRIYVGSTYHPQITKVTDGSGKELKVYTIEQGYLAASPAGIVVSPDDIHASQLLQVSVSQPTESSAFIDYPIPKVLHYELELVPLIKEKATIPVLQIGSQTDFFNFAVSSDAPIVIDGMGQLIPVNPEKMPTKVLAAIDIYNKGSEAVLKLRTSQLTAREKLWEVLYESMDDLRHITKVVTGTPNPSEPQMLALENTLAKVKTALHEIQQEERITNVLSETLSAAENSPLKSKLATAQALKANPKLAEEAGISSKFLGIGANIILFAPHLQDYAESIDNANLILAARSINTAAILTLPVAGGLALKSIVSAGLTGGTSAAFGTTKILGANYGISLAISYVTTIVGTTVYCALNTKSQLCGCRVTDDYGGKPLLQLQKYEVKSGETIKYRILGFENCPTHPGLEALFGIQNMASIPAPPPTLEADKHELKTLCEWQKSGNWCLGEFTVNLNPGQYDLKVLQPVIATSGPQPIVFYPWDTGQELVVNP